MNKLIHIILFVLITNCLFAQKEANIWYFGDSAGLDFNSGTPVALTNGALDTWEGCATISDDNGSLLFYTDGVTVWNKNHTPMPNGTGLMGHSSSTQSAIIVPHPDNKNIYYIFTVDEGGYLNPPNEGLRYSIVDMTLLGGLGDVTSAKNVLLIKPATEKLTAVKHCNGRDVWVITHEWNTNAFYAYIVTGSGLNTTPVISNTGITHSGNISNTIGCLKVSAKGDKLALAYHMAGFLELFDFDNSTGIITNPITFSNSSLYNKAYGIEFSPDGTKLYASCINEILPGLSEIFQFNLQAGSPADIINSCVVVDSSISNSAFYSLQLGPDKKIYVAKGITLDSIGVINNPNALGISCNYVYNAVSLNGKRCRLGLPNFIQSYFYLDFTYQNTCFGDSTMFTIKDTTGIDSVLWNFDDPGSAPFNTSTIVNPFHIFSSPGTYNVLLISYSGTTSDTLLRCDVIIHPIPNVNLGNDTAICEGFSIILDAGGGYSSYQWQNGNSNQTMTADSTQIYWVEVTDTNGCIGRDTIQLIVTPYPVININDTSVCSGDSVKLTATGGTSYEWNTGETTASITVSPKTVTTYTVTVTNGCTASEDIIVTIYPVPPAPDVSDIAICLYEDGILSVNNPVTGYSYYWYDSLVGGTLLHTGTTYNITTPSTITYYVQCKDEHGCFSSRVPVTVTLGLTPIADFSVDTFAFEGQQIQFFDHSTDANNWHWSFGDGQFSTDRNPKHGYSVEGIYIVTLIVCSGTIPYCCDTITKTMNILKKTIVLVPTTFTPNGDDKNEILYVKGEGILELIFQIFNQWGILIFESNNQLVGWDGKHENNPQPEGNYVYILEAKTSDGQDIHEQGTVSLIR